MYLKNLKIQIAKSKENNLITGELNKTIYMDFVKENELPASVRFDLSKTF